MINWFARNQVAANLLMVAILALGAWSLSSRIPLEVFPSFERDIVTVTMSYRGATPTEVEEAIVIRIEEAIADLEGIKQITSSANEGVGQVMVEIESNLEPRDMLDEIKNRVDTIIGFPTDVEKPNYKIQSRTREVISVAVVADLPEKKLRDLGEQVRDDIAALPEISLVDLQGVRAYEMAIEVSENTLDRYGLTFDQVLQAVRRSSLDQPAGSIKTNAGEILLRTKGQAYNAEDFAQISVINRPDGTRLSLGEIATIRDSFEEEAKNTVFNGQQAVMVEVFRTGQQNAIEVAAAVRDYVLVKNDQLPAGVTLHYWRDRSQVVKQRLQTLTKSAWQGGLLVFLCLTLFLRFSVAVWVCIGIPISFMGALAIMPEMGTTLNLISLFAFILVLGIVVDDAIITGENIYSHMKKGKQQGLEAAITGAQEVSVPVTFGLLTTLAAFSPLLMIEGVRGAIFAQIPMIVIPVLLFSWVESKLILPAHLSHIRIKPASETGLLTRLQEVFADGLERVMKFLYRPLLSLALNYRYLTFAIFIAVSFVILSFVISGRYGYTFFPKVQSEIVRATLRMQVGTSAEVTKKYVDKMNATAEVLQGKYTDEESGESAIKNIMTSVGWTSWGSHSGGISRGDPELGQVSLELIPPEQRKVPISTFEFVKEWRKAIGPIPGVKELNLRAELGRGGSPIDVQLTGDDFTVLKDVIEEIRGRLSEYPGVFDIQDSLEDGKTEIELVIRPEAELLGISSSDLGRQVRYAFFGAEAQRIQRGRDDVRVMIKYPQEERRSIGDLDKMRIRTADGQQIPIGNVTEIKPGLGFSTIRRVDRHRAVNVTADIDKKTVDLNKITVDLTTLLEEIRQRYPEVRYTLEGEQREQRESFGSLRFGGIFVLFCIYALLAIPLKSYLQPIVVMLVIPFSLVGAILGHMLLGMSLSIMSAMGILALAGVVVNDSLVLVDWINRRKAEGVKITEAVRMAGSARFRPILLTSITTFAGLAPLIWEKSTQAQFLIPMAVSLGFGILYATLLSLILVPTGYLILNDLQTLFNRSTKKSETDLAELIE
ncbi:MAG: efflux RND transporter permease subunit [Gammaproteobacteria bacterium]